jgi:hypothetical protein
MNRLQRLYTIGILEQELKILRSNALDAAISFTPRSAREKFHYQRRVMDLVMQYKRIENKIAHLKSIRDTPGLVEDIFLADLSEVI